MARLLFVDDEHRDFLLWGKPFEDYGWEVVYASSAEDAFSRLEEDSKTSKLFDVIIIDRKMRDPETGEDDDHAGDKLLEKVAGRWPYICPIILTRFADDVEGAQRATKNGAFHYFVKKTKVEELERACRNGMTAQFAKQLRQSLVALGTVKDIVAELKKRIGELVDASGCCFAYLEIGPGGMLMSGDSAIKDKPGALATALHNKSAYLEKFQSAKEVVRNRHYALKTHRRECSKQGGTLIASPGSQLIVPILRPQNPRDRKEAEVVALIWVESKKEKAFDWDNANILSDMADYVAIAFERAISIEKHGDEARQNEREGLISDVAHRICNPLQVAQSNVDYLVASIERNGSKTRGCKAQTFESGELRQKLAEVLESLEQAIVAADQLRQGTNQRAIKLRPINLGLLVKESVDAFHERAQSHSVRIQTSITTHVPLVLMSPAEMRYILNCLLTNAIEAINDRKNGRAGKAAKGEINISVNGDPDSKGVLILVKDNGAGIDPAHMDRMFDRYFTTKGDDFTRGRRGLGLWHAKRFIEHEAIGGLIRARNNNGAEFSIILPACAQDTPPREITM